MEAYPGSVSVNPFMLDTDGDGFGDSTPNIVGLEGGAEAFGLLDFDRYDGVLNACDLFTGDPRLDPEHPDFDGVLTQRPDAAAMLLRVDVGPAGYNQDYRGYDMVLMVNLTASPVNDPHLGVGDVYQPLLTGGWENDPDFGGAGDVETGQLDGYQVYATLVPEWVTQLQFGAQINGEMTSMRGEVANGAVLYLTEATILDRVNQQYAPQGETFAGQDWRVLGSFDTSKDIISVDLFNEGDGNMAADALRLQRHVLPMLKALDLRGNPLGNHAHEFILAGLGHGADANGTRPGGFPALVD
jgi:hypothetical protein